MKRFILGTAATGFGLASLGMAVPLTAQDLTAETEAEAALVEALGVEGCAEAEPPCLTEEGMVLFEDGTEMSLEEAQALLSAEDPAPTPGAEAAADIEHEEVIEEENLAEDLAEDMAVEPEVAPEAEPRAGEEVLPVEEAEISPAEEEMDAEAVTEEPVVEAPAEEPVAEEADVRDPMPEEEAAEAPTAEQVSEEAPEPRPAEIEAEAEAYEEAQEEVQAEEAQAPAAEATPEAEQVTEVAEENPEAAGEAVAVEMTEEDLQEQAQAEAEAEAQAAEEVPAAAAAAAVSEDGTEGEPAADVEVQTETVTEENSRASDEEFARAETKSADEDDGLSNLEKFLIGAVGAAVVGQVLSDKDQVVENTGDRVVVERDGQLRVLKNDDALLRQPGSDVTTETFPDGSTRTTLSRADGTQVVTIRAADGRVLRRDRVFANGERVVLFDDTQQVDSVDVTALPDAPKERVEYAEDEDALRAALAASQAQSKALNRRFSLNQIRSIRAVRELAPEIELTSVNFASGSAAISPSEAEELAALGRAMKQAIAENPREVFLVEGHTDAVGKASMNLALSDRRAESLALALSEYFDVPPENMVVQGYGERYLKVPTVDAERANRRAAVRIITPLLGQAVASEQ
nr:OmpA family protein [uncultured Celeribacter sp.]